MESAHNSKLHKILILGDAGRGKTTFAKKLAAKLGVPHFTTDDFYFIKKFDVVREPEESIRLINEQVYDGLDGWVVDGTTKRLIKDGLEKSDAIFLLEFKNILSQYRSIIRRYFERRGQETLSNLWGMLKHVTYKRYRKSYSSHRSHLHALIKPYEHKIVRLHTFKEIDAYLENL